MNSSHIAHIIPEVPLALLKKLVIVGGKGNGTVIASTVDDVNSVRPTWDLLGYFNDSDTVGATLNSYPVLGRPRDMVKAEWSDVQFVFSIISLRYGRSNATRLESMNLPRERFATVIHPTAVISRYCSIGVGVAVMPFAHVGPNAYIGDHVFLGGSSFVGHNAHLEAYSYLATNSVVGANVVLRRGAYLGSNATTREDVTLGEWSVVGIGSAVIRDVPALAVVAGNPCRPIRDRVFETYEPTLDGEGVKRRS